MVKFLDKVGKMFVGNLRLICYICVVIIFACLYVSCCKKEEIVGVEGFSGNSDESKCTSCSAGSGDGKGKGLLPIMEAKFNIREICKNCLLLEDHLISPRKRCNDCIRKHFLIIEGLGDEAKTLDKKGEFQKELEALSDTIYKLQKDYINGKNMNEIGQELRQTRKKLVPICFNEITPLLI